MNPALYEQIANLKVVCLAGGVGGAKLAAGLARVLSTEQLTIIVNTGDDFQHLGLTICPDIDTVMYTLAGAANQETGWGRAGETWKTMEETARLGGPSWFNLGDLDLATHLVRTQLLDQGETLTAVTNHLCTHLGIKTRMLPMSNEAAPTLIETDNATLPFQIWFVKERWQPPLRQVKLPEDVKATPQVAQALEAVDLVFFAPSNPFVSIDPILNVYPIREMIMDLPLAVIAVSPIVGGIAIKGPAAKIMTEMGLTVSPAAVASYYGDLIDGFIFDQQDAGLMQEFSCAAMACDTIMVQEEDRDRLAREALQFALSLIE